MEGQQQVASCMQVEGRGRPGQVAHLMLRWGREFQGLLAMGCLAVMLGQGGLWILDDVEE